MALPAIMLDYVCRAAEEIGGGRACSAGYPDLLVRKPQLVALLGEQRVARIPVRPDSAEILAWHRMTGKFEAVYDSRVTFEQIGLSLDVIDIAPVRGDEIILDLNMPLPDSFDRRFDIVVDTGTCEHCFHVGQAAMNLAQLVRKGGYIVQAMPLSSMNHGFYNINPTWFHDFYPANGFAIRLLAGVTDIVLEPSFFEVPPHANFGPVPDRAAIVVVAQREAEVAPATPVQWKYRQHSNLKRKGS